MDEATETAVDATDPNGRDAPDGRTWQEREADLRAHSEAEQQMFDACGMEQDSIVE